MGRLPRNTLRAVATHTFVTLGRSDPLPGTEVRCRMCSAMHGPVTTRHEHYHAQLKALDKLRAELAGRSAIDAGVVSRLCAFRRDWDEQALGPFAFAVACWAFENRRVVMVGDGAQAVWRAYVGLALGLSVKSASTVASVVALCAAKTPNQIKAHLDLIGGVYGRGP